MWLNLLMLRWILAISWPLIDRAVSAHFRTNRSRDRSQAWWTHSLWYSPDRINFSHALLNSRCLLASNWSISFRAFAANSWSDRPQIWWANSQRGLSWPDQRGFLLQGINDLNFGFQLKCCLVLLHGAADRIMLSEHWTMDRQKWIKAFTEAGIASESAYADIFVTEKNYLGKHGFVGSSSVERTWCGSMRWNPNHYGSQFCRFVSRANRVYSELQDPVEVSCSRLWFFVS